MWRKDSHYEKTITKVARRKLVCNTKCNTRGKQDRSQGNKEQSVKFIVKIIYHLINENLILVLYFNLTQTCLVYMNIYLININENTTLPPFSIIIKKNLLF